MLNGLFDKTTVGVFLAYPIALMASYVDYIEQGFRILGLVFALLYTLYKIVDLYQRRKRDERSEGN